MLQVPFSAELLSSLTTSSINVNEIIDFVLHIVYNRKQAENMPGESRYAMLFKIGRNSKRKRFTDKKDPNRWSHVEDENKTFTLRDIGMAQLP